MGRLPRQEQLQSMCMIEHEINDSLYDVSCLLTLTARFAPADTLSQMLTYIALKGLPFPDTTGLPVALNHYFMYALQPVR